jgi:peptidyl-prolyl cis-trans isomerase A (cyclophilin A)/peptidyl-prolyl cis-trans isomerase B (cyclophilin B)
MRIVSSLYLKLVISSVLALASISGLAQNAPKVEMKTSMGEIVIEVYPDKAPLSADNFLKYVKDGFYNGTIFHRIINGFMVQGGGYDKSMKEKTTRAPIQNEAKNGLKNQTYTIAMARTADPHSASAQFFINVNNNSFLDYPGQDGWGYAVFGKVIKGSEVIEKMKGVETNRRDQPTSAVVIESARIIE